MVFSVLSFPSTLHLIKLLLPLDEGAVNVTGVPGVKVGDEVVLIGTQGSNTITAEDVAKWLNCSVLELLTTIMPRNTRQ